MPWLIVVLSYLIGSFPTAYIAGRLLKGRDIRQMGDGNVGADNAYRQFGPKVGVAVGLADAGKGALAILIAQAVSMPQMAVLTAGIAVVAGHNWPAFIGFKGGRGESTTIGVLLTVVTQPMMIVAGPTVITLLATRNVVLTSIVLFIPVPLLCWWLGIPLLLSAYAIALPCLVGFTHFLRTRRSEAHQP
jgi:glycerol-3-phosphate acyltransferase PlsY